MKDTITKLRSIDEAIAVLEKEYPHGIDLIYINYDESFSNSLDALNRAIQANNIYDAWPDDPDWFSDAMYETIQEVLNSNFTEEELEAWSTEEKNELENWLQDHDTSNPAKQMLKNTGNVFFFYDTGLEIPEYPSYGGGQSFVTKHAKRIANKLKIDYKKHEKILHSLIANSCYGGKLVLAFYTDPDTLLTEADKDANYIRVKKAQIVIMNRDNGSGDSDTIDEIVALPFNRKNLWIDSEAGGYSINDVFGFYLPAFEQTPSLHWEVKARKTKTTNLQAEAERYAKFDELVKQGKCAFADPRFNSHDTEYIMNFPMGNKCKRCGRFFID